MNKMPAEVAQTPTEQADVTQPPGLGESPNSGQTRSVKSKTPDGNPSARLSLDLPLAAQRYRGASNGEVRRGDTRTNPHDSTDVGAADRGTAHFYRRHNDRLPGNGFCESLAFDMQRQWPHGSGGCDLLGSQTRDLEASQRRADYRDRHGRRYQSERPLQQQQQQQNHQQQNQEQQRDTSVQNEWSRANGGHLHQNGTSSGDDMENYFNANAHLLAYLELNDGPEQNGPVYEGSLGENEPRMGENGVDGLLQGCQEHVGGGNGVMNGDAAPHRSQLMLSTSVEDQGDFIEPDLYPGSQELDPGCNSQLSSSEEELPQLTPSSSASRRTQAQQKLSLKFNSGSVRKPGDGPKLVAPPNNTTTTTHNLYSSVCDYKKNEEQEVPRPVSFGAANRLCTCSVVSYSLGRPDLTSSQSMSSGEVDEGVGGMKVSPAEHSPSESEGGGAQCGVTVTSDSSSYFSPEDVDFMDFDMEPAMATPSDNVREFGVSTNIPYQGGRGTGVSRDYPEETNSNDRESSCMISCEDCSKPGKDCLCQRLHVCKRLLEVAKNIQERASASTEPCCSSESFSYEQQRLNCIQTRKENMTRCGCFNPKIGGNDSGAGSQEHLDELSSDDQTDEVDLQPVCPPPRSCNCPVSRYYLGAPLCDQHDLYCHDTNNLDVEVFNAPSSDYEDELFNVSRQTSTSNFDQDENAYQDAVEDLASNGFHSACSGSDLESEKNNHTCKDHGTSDHRPDVGVVFPETVPPHSAPEIPLPIPSRDEESPRRRPPSIPPAALNPGHDTEGSGASGVERNSGPRPSWSTQSSEDISPMGALNWSDYDAPSDETDASRRPRLFPALAHPSNDLQAFVPYTGSSSDQDYLNSPTNNLENDGLGFRVDNSMHDENTLGHPSARSRPEFLHDSEVTFPDTIPDIFILNLLREKESRCQDSVSPSRSSVEKVMIWSEYDAYVTQVKQIGSSACGATAVINVLKALDIYVEKCVVSRAVHTNLRAERAPLPEYLLSRSIAGCTAEHLIQGIETATEGQVFGRFFCFYPEREVDILSWLGDWIKRGAVPILTLNLQKAVPQGWEIPDAWHHQMAYGIGPKGVYLTNPLELVLEEVIMEQLTSDSELLVQRHDVISRWNAETDLGMLLCQQDPRWRQMNVLGQVVNILREARRPRVMGFRPQLTTHIRIPAWYRPGVSLFVRRDSDTYHELRTASELPIKIHCPEENRQAATSATIPRTDSRNPLSTCDLPRTESGGTGMGTESELQQTLTPPGAGTSHVNIAQGRASTSTQDIENSARFQSDLNTSNDAQLSEQSVPRSSSSSVVREVQDDGVNVSPQDQVSGESLPPLGGASGALSPLEEPNVRVGDMNVMPNSSNLPDHTR